MKGPLFIPAALLAAAVSLSLLDTHKAGEAAPAVATNQPARTWYYVDRDNSLDLAGTSTRGPDEIAALLTRGEFLRLDECREMDAQGKWTPVGGQKVSGTIYVRANLVRSFQELTGDPMEPVPAK